MLTRTHHAIAKCFCGGILLSFGGGKFLSCVCEKSFIDQERWSAAYVRVGGSAEFIEQICPSICEHREGKHLGQIQITTVGELKRYIKTKYKIKL